MFMDHHFVAVNFIHAVRQHLLALHGDCPYHCRSIYEICLSVTSFLVYYSTFECFPIYDIYVNNRQVLYRLLRNVVYMVMLPTTVDLYVICDCPSRRSCIDLPVLPVSIYTALRIV